MDGRILAVDLGEKNIGLAISDPTGTIASPLEVIRHTSGIIDAGQIAQKADEYDVQKIVIGIPITEGKGETPQTRHVKKFATILGEQTTIPIVLWDESFSTNRAQEIRQLMNVRRKARSGHLDNLAASVILQNYLEEGALNPE